MTRTRLLLLVLALASLAGTRQGHAQTQNPYVTLTGVINGANGLPAANELITLQPTQTFYVVGTGVVPQGGGCSTLGIPTLNGTVIGDNTSTNCGYDNRAGDSATVPANTSTFGYLLLGNNTAQYVTAMGTTSGTGNQVSDMVAIGHNAASNTTPNPVGASDVVAIGDQPLVNAVNLDQTVAIGNHVLYGADGEENVGMGRNDGTYVSGFDIVAIGDNNALGTQANPCTTDFVVAIGEGNEFNCQGTHLFDVIAIGHGTNLFDAPNTGNMQDVIALGNGSASLTGAPVGHYRDVVAIGDEAAGCMTNATDIVAIGDTPISCNEAATVNNNDIVAIGNGAASGLVSGSSTVIAIGLVPLDTGSWVTTPQTEVIAMGDTVGNNNTGSDIVALGDDALTGAHFGNSGNDIVAVGNHVLAANTSGHDNIAIGDYAGANGWTDSGNGNANLTGSNNVWIGNNAGPSTTTQLSNTIAIGNLAQNTASNQTVIGNSSITSLKLFGCSSGQAVLADGSATCFTPGGGGSGATLQTNGGNNTSQALLNFVNPSTFNGLTFTFSNPSGGIETFAVGGTLGNSGLTNPSTTVNGQSCALGGTCAIPNFTSGAAGLAPASGGGTTNFLRADGTWAAPGGGGSTAWSALTNPSTNLALTMASNTTTFTYGATTGSADLMKWTDTTGNTGTGILGHFHTASGSTEIPWCADANGVGWCVNPDGSLSSTGTSGVAGVLQLGAGTPPSAAPTSTIQIYSPATVTAYSIVLPNAQPTATSQFITCTNANPSVCSFAAPSGSGNVTAGGTLAANQIVLGAGTTAVATLGSLGTTTTVLHGNAAGAPSFGAVSLTADVTGNLPNPNLATQTANTVLGALTATTPSGLAVPSCSTSSSALQWTSGSGFGCNTTETQTIASGTSALGTSAIGSGACATVVTTTATGTATTDVVAWGFNADPTSTTGYSPTVNGMLTIIAYPTANNVNFKVCNNTLASITPGAVTLNWRIVR